MISLLKDGTVDLPWSLYTLNSSLFALAGGF